MSSPMVNFKFILRVLLRWGIQAVILGGATFCALAGQPPSVSMGARNMPADKPRFAVVKGKGWSVCEHYARFLNSQPKDEPLPLCHLKLSPELKEPDWETLDIQAHLHTIYTIEYPPYRNAINPDKPPPPFERWKEQFRQRQKDGETPRLRRTRLALVEDGPVETILAYEADRDHCDKMVKSNGYTAWGDGAGIWLWDERKNRIDDYASWIMFPSSPARFLLFHGKPLMFLTAWGDVLIPPYNKVHVGGRIAVRHVFPAQGSSDRYGDEERCQIGFDLPSNIVERMTK